MNGHFEEANKKLRNREMSTEERQEVIASMSDNLDTQDNPNVGIFWYDEKKDELFGVNKVQSAQLQFSPKGLKTYNTLDKDWWQKQKQRLLGKGAPLGIFVNDYTSIPRGRVFEREGVGFQLMVGKWIDDYGKDKIENLVKDEFNLQNVPFETIIDTHWDIGHGWSQEFV